VVLEARDRIGGRVNTDYERFESPVDLGASIITGLKGNPIGVLVKQLRTKVHHIDTQCPLYGQDGKLLDQELDDNLFEFYNLALGDCDYLRQVRTFFSTFCSISAAAAVATE
jgi:phytoene dehydrogenase-like protein